MKRTLLPYVVASVVVTLASQCILISDWFPTCTGTEIKALYNTTIAIICLIATQLLYTIFIYKDKKSDLLSSIPKHLLWFGNFALSTTICFLLNHSFYGLVVYKDLLLTVCNTTTFEDQYPQTKVCVILSYCMYTVAILLGGYGLVEPVRPSQFKKTRYRADEDFLDLRSFQ